MRTLPSSSPTLSFGKALFRGAICILFTRTRVSTPGSAPSPNFISFLYYALALELVSSIQRPIFPGMSFDWREAGASFHGLLFFCLRTYLGRVLVKISFRRKFCRSSHKQSVFKMPLTEMGRKFPIIIPPLSPLLLPLS